ncbi:LytTR family DNA-binding domain-containing protein [Psychroserpens sp.]|uniref:LytR/AlgR family response regulator transcription factor n=1 Tax=Psychroserpens sp. TaxID=2020870 RepID=UPI001B1389C4|nr:LytTR family DNA-binding domain-containing protein [Psychroserpens sp.]MBO6605703.1 response regulator transcription factor [Psychroserpens sp.]MBO6630438.1 response regulator transcription factor [Psychroserpens sp.]MBO6652926.1 response regulator transcription factor [Psychroserpens sp.]MBO6681302.1 response regulator transcription factor [Psychroserpens sp.]MBO6749077.1 response regulator transcription factor [Psychroserpens sp.]
MNYIIIDDEATARAIISQLCSNIEDLNVIEEFPNAIQAIKYLNQNEVDLIFLDIHMPDFTGFDFIETIKNPPRIILTTSDSNFAIQAFEYDCIVDYLVKPITQERFNKAIQKAKSQQVQSAPYQSAEPVETTSGNDLYVNIDRRLIKIDIPSIYLVEAKGDYIYVKAENQNYTVHSTLKKIEDKLPNDLFLKVHRSYIINVSKIIDIEDNSVLIKKDVIPVSRSNRPELMKRLNLL